MHFYTKINLLKNLDLITDKLSKVPFAEILEIKKNKKKFDVVDKLYKQVCKLYNEVSKK